NSGQPPDTEGKLPVRLWGVNCCVTTAPVKDPGGVHQTGEGPLSLLIRIGRERSGALVVVMEGHVAALGPYRGQTAEYSDNGGPENSQSLHWPPYAKGNIRARHAIRYRSSCGSIFLSVFAVLPHPDFEQLACLRVGRNAEQ